jgi:hypothetical protein
VTITNSGPDPAFNVTLNDTVDPNTTIVPGSATSTPIATDETYDVLGNVRIQPNAANGLLANDVNPNTGNNTGLTASGPTTGPTNGQATVNADGSFSYNPNPGFTGTDSFTYTVTSSGGTDTATVTLNVTGMIWFVNAAASPGGDGRLTSPFNCLVGAGCFDPVAADDPGDNIFLYTGAYSDTGALTLLNNQKVIGQGTSSGTTLDAAAGVTLPPHSDALPALNGNPGSVTVTSTASGIVVTTGNTNTLRGFTLGNSASGAKIFSTAFGTLNVSEVALTGTGTALNLDSGTLAATFTSIASTSAAGQGIALDQIAGTLTSTGGTTITDPATQGILVTASTADINFGNTTVSDATDAISLQNNSAGTRSFGTITTTGGTGVGFLHSTGGGAVNVTGATSITNPAGNGIDIDASNANLSFAATAVNKNSTGGIGVDLTNNATRTISFTSLTVTTTNAFALNTNNSGTVNAGGGSLTQSGAGGGAASLTNTALGLTFTSVSSNGGGNGLIFSGGSGTFTSGTTNLQNNAGIGLLMSSSAVAANFGNTTVNSSAGDGVDLSSNTGNISFGDLDITPDANLRGLDASNNTGIISSTSGDIATSGAPAINIAGPAGRTPLSMTLTNVDSVNSTTLGVDLNLVSGNLTVNDPTLATNITNPTGIGIQVRNSGAGTINFGNTSVTASGGTGVVIGTTSNGNTGNVSFADLDITPDSGQRALQATHNTGVITTTTGSITGGLGAIAVEIVGQSAVTRTPLNIQLERIDGNGNNTAANAIILTNTSASGAPGGFRVNGTGTTVGSGGTIQNTTTRGANINTVDSLVLKNMNFTNANSSVDGGGAGVCDDLTISGCNAAIYLNGVTTLATLDNLDLTGTMVENGITAIGVANFKLDNSLIDGAGNEVHESGVEAQNLSGTSTITGTEIRFSETDAFAVLNTDVSWNLTISGSTFRDSQTVSSGGAVNTNGEGGFQFRSFSVAAGTPSATINILNSSFLRLRTQAIQVFSNDDTTINLDVNNNTLDAQADIGTGIDINADDNSTFQFNILNNPTIQSRGGAAVNITSFINGHMEGRVNNNPDIEVLGGAGIPVRLVAQETSTMVVEINGNTVSNVNGTEDTAIDVQSRFQTARVDATITNNNVTVEPTGIAAINLTSGSSTAGESNITCGDVANNTANTAAVTARAFRIRVSDLSNTNRLFLEGFVEAGNALQDTVATWNGRGNTPVSVGGSEVAASLTGTAVGPLAPPGGVCNAVDTPSDFGPTIIARRNEPDSLPISRASAPLFAQRTSIIAANGTSLENNSFVRSNSKRDGGATFNYAVAGTSAPLGQTPSRGSQDKKTTGGSRKPAAPSTGNTPQQTGGPTKPTAQTPTTGAVVDPGLRFAPKPKAAALPPVIMGDNLTWNIGTLPAGGSVTITFEVVVDNPFTGAMAQVSNQGTVTADGGISVLTDDPDVAGPNNPTVTLVAVPPNLSVSDASVAEPASGSTSMIFTLALSAPAPMGGITANVSTADGTATGGTCAGGNDYESVSGGLITFNAGDQIKTFPVTVCSDAAAEGDETFTLNINSAPGAVVTDGTATGTITANVPGTIIISELRTSGPGGDGDDFVEIYNNTDASHTVPAGGYGLFKRGASCDALPVLIGTIPAGAIIPQRGHYLFTGSAYSLANYGGTGAAAGDQALAADIESDFNVGLFSTVDPLAISTANRLDAVGFGVSTGGVCDLLLEGTTLPPASGSTSQYSFVREFTLVSNNVPTPTDGNDNATDFTVVSTTGTPVGANASTLGAPGPENLASPPLKKFTQVGAFFLDQTKAPSAEPNRHRDLTVVPNGALGTLSSRRRFVNNTGGAITRLRFRIYDITTFPSPTGTADLRALTSVSASVGPVADPVTCAAAGLTPPCTVTVLGTTLEEPPSQSNGGGLNSSMTAGTITLATPLADGASINLQFLFGIQQSGSFRVFVFVEALP